MASALTAAALVMISYLIGAIPFTNLFALRSRGVDLREVGTGTVSGTGVYRVAGVAALLVAGALDVAKGAVGPLLAGGSNDAVLAATAVAAVIGHNWSIFLRFAGGRGLATTMGALLVIAWPGAVVILAGLVVGRAFRETGLGAFFAIVLLPVVLALTDGLAASLTGLALSVVLLAKRVVGNAPARPRGPRIYLNRLLFDCDHH